MGPRGFAYDRNWMLVTADGRFLTQREIPWLALIESRIGDGEIRFRFGDELHSLPLNLDGEPMAVRIWRSQVTASRQSASLDQGLSTWLGRAVRLVKFGRHARRQPNPERAPRGSEIAFPDGYPILVTNLTSLDRLNERLMERGSAPVPMNRFRPNLVIEGAQAFAEERFCQLRHGENRLLLVKPCDRCVVTTIDQRTAEKTDGEPIATLKRFLRHPELGPCFGHNAVPDPNSVSFQMRKGDALTFAGARERCWLDDLTA